MYCNPNFMWTFVLWPLTSTCTYFSCEWDFRLYYGKLWHEQGQSMIFKSMSSHCLEPPLQSLLGALPACTCTGRLAQSLLSVQTSLQFLEGSVLSQSSNMALMKGIYHNIPVHINTGLGMWHKYQWITFPGWWAQKGLFVCIDVELPAAMSPAPCRNQFWKGRINVVVRKQQTQWMRTGNPGSIWVPDSASVAQVIQVSDSLKCGCWVFFTFSLANHWEPPIKLACCSLQYESFSFSKTE